MNRRDFIKRAVGIPAVAAGAVWYGYTMFKMQKKMWMEFRIGDAGRPQFRIRCSCGAASGLLEHDGGLLAPTWKGTGTHRAFDDHACNKSKQ